MLNRLAQITNKPEETAVIILGDAGFNFYLNKTDKKLKQTVQNTGFTIYVVRGNHEQRPELLSNILTIWDEDVQGQVYVEEAYSRIRYLQDGGVYTLNHQYKTLVIGGAYSVDKWYRLNGQDPNTTSWTGWFKNEQLTSEEMNNIARMVNGQSYDLVLTHTCPIDWQPTDLFLKGLDQSSVDNTMEKWLLEIKDSITYNIWLFGHFHDDRLVRPHVEMFFRDMENIEDLLNTWDNYDKTKEVPWWMVKDPNFYMGR